MGKFLEDLLTIAIIILICDCCGCGIMKKMGSLAGECYNSFKEKTTEVHPSDLR